MEIRTEFGQAHAIYDDRRIICNVEMPMTRGNECDRPTTTRKQTPFHGLLEIRFHHLELVGCIDRGVFVPIGLQYVGCILKRRVSDEQYTLYP